MTGLALDHSQVVEGMTEVRQLESLKVGKNMSESDARKLAKEKGVKIFTMGQHTKDTHFGQMPFSCERLCIWSGKRV